MIGIKDATAAVAYAPGSGQDPDSWTVYFDAEESDEVVDRYLRFDRDKGKSPDEVGGLEAAIRSEGLTFRDDPHWTIDCPGTWSARVLPVSP
jgi:hypothetical protein